MMKGNPQLMVEKVQQANLVNRKAARFFSPLSYVDGRKGALSPNVRGAKNSTEPTNSRNRGLILKKNSQNQSRA